MEDFYKINAKRWPYEYNGLRNVCEFLQILTDSEREMWKS